MSFSSLTKLDDCGFKKAFIQAKNFELFDVVNSMIKETKFDNICLKKNIQYVYGLAVEHRNDYRKKYHSTLNQLSQKDQALKINEKRIENLLEERKKLQKEVADLKKVAEKAVESKRKNEESENELKLIKELSKKETEEWKQKAEIERNLNISLSSKSFNLEVELKKTKDLCQNLEKELQDNNNENEENRMVLSQMKSLLEKRQKLSNQCSDTDEPAWKQMKIYP